MFIIWMQRFYPTGFTDGGDPYYSVDSLAKVENSEYQKAMSYYQKDWARREDMDCEVTIQSYELPTEYEDCKAFPCTFSQPLVVIDENGERGFSQIPGPQEKEYVRKFDKKAFDYRYFFLVHSDPVFGGVELIFDLPLLNRKNKLPRKGIYANSFEEALNKAYNLT